MAIACAGIVKRGVTFTDQYGTEHEVTLSIGGVEPCGPNGRQWFSVQGVTEENRQARIDAVMPAFIDGKNRFVIGSYQAE
mgnify:CR=1 FL=1